MRDASHRNPGKNVALSIEKAEYMCLSKVAKEALYLRSSLKEIGLPSYLHTKIGNDNQGARSYV